MDYLQNIFARDLMVRVASVFSVGIITLLIFPTLSFAATLSITPANGSVQVGQVIVVTAMVSSPDQSLNAISGTLTFPSDLLSVESASKAGSVLTLWVEEPAISNSAGNVSWSAVVPNPGFTGRGQVVSVVFRAKKVGTASLALSQSQVLANDGSGTNIFTSASGGSITILEADKTIPIAPPISSKPASAITLTPPTIIAYTKEPQASDSLIILGNTEYKRSLVTLHSAPPISSAVATTTSDADGNFYFVFNDTAQGAYIVTLDVTVKGLVSSSTDPITISVGGQLMVIPGGSKGSAWLLVLILIGIIATLSWLLLTKERERREHERE